jgi:hypothetical protein
MPNPLENSSSSEGGSIIKTFQLSSDVKWKSDIKIGHKIAKDIQATLGGNTSYYFIRNSRFAKNRSMVSGRYDMSRFMDRLQLNGKFNYVNISWLPFHLVSTVVTRKVGGWMNRNEKISVNAVDAESEAFKKQQYEDAEFYLDNKEKLMKLQEESGVQVMPQNVPQDKDELDIWAVENNRLPEEIKYETGTNGLLSQEGLFDVIKERTLRDSAITGLVGLFTWMDEKGVIHNEYVKPEDAIYSYSEFPDFRDTTWRARIVSRKISEIRRKYGVEFGGKMTEEEIFNLAQTAKQYQVPDKIRWISEWSYSTLRPYDEWNIDCIEIAFKSLDSDGFKMKVTNSGTLIMDKSAKRFEPSDNKEYIPDDGWNMYWGVYARSADKMLEWGLMKNQIKAQDVKEIGNVEFPFSFYMYQNEDMRNLAIPEKVEKPFEQMALVLLKMEQLIAKLRPIGAKINVNSIRELDLGLADLVKPLEVEKIYDQTGNLYYTDRDAEGNLIGDPITELANAGFQQQAEGLIRMYQFWYQTLKDELGEDPNLSQQAAQPRVTEGNIQTSIQQANNATDYMYDAYLHVMEDAARKTACLMHDSVSFGANVYRHIIGEDEVEGRVFATKVKMLPTDKEMATIEMQINQAIASNKDLVMYLNTFKILRIAKEDIKLAEEYFRLGMKRMLQSQIAQAQQNQEATFKAQVESGRTAEQEKRTTEEMKGDIDIKKTKAAGEAQNRTSVINMVTSWLAPSADGTVGKVPPEYQPLVSAVVQNIMVSAIAATEEQKQEIIAKMQEAQMQQQQEQIEQQQGQEPQQMQPLEAQQQNLQPA